MDENNMRHDVWFLDAVTALNQMRAARTLGINTFALWRLGSEDRSLWAVWDKPGDGSSPNKLSIVPPGQDVDIEGRARSCASQSRPSAGEREITVDPDTNLDQRRDLSGLCPRLTWSTCTVDRPARR